MLNYKRIALSLSIIAGIGMGATTQADAFLGGIFSKKLSDEEVAGKILDTVKKFGKTQFCRQGNAKELVFSIRSFEGAAANSKTLAALGMLVCSADNPEGFSTSHFHDKAVAKLGTSDLGEIQKMFIESLKSAKGKALALGCTVASGGALASGVGAPVTAAIGSVCAKAQ